MSLARYPVAVVALTAAGFIAVKTGRDAVFFSQGGLRQLPLVYILTAAASLPAGWGHLAAIRRFGARSTRVAVFLAAGAVIATFAPFVDRQHPGAMLAFFALVPAVFAAVFAAGWLLVGDLLEGAPEEARRQGYAQTGAAAMLGSIAGGLAARGLVPALGPDGLVAAGAGIVVLAGGVAARAQRACPGRSRAEAPRGQGDSPRRRPAAGVRTAGPLSLLRQPFVGRLAAISGLAAAVALLIDFQFYAAATLTGRADARFFAGFYTALNAVALLLQLGVTPRVQARYGVGGALMALPLALLGGLAGASALGAAFAGRSLLRVTEGGLKASIHRSSWEQAFVPLGAARDAAKVVVDGLAGRVAEGLAALTLLAWLRAVPELDGGVSLAWISWTMLAGLLAWVALTRGLFPLAGAAAADPAVRIPDCCPVVATFGGRQR